MHKLVNKLSGAAFTIVSFSSTLVAATQALYAPAFNLRGHQVRKRTDQPSVKLVVKHLPSRWQRPDLELDDKYTAITEEVTHFEQRTGKKPKIVVLAHTKATVEALAGKLQVSTAC